MTNLKVYKRKVYLEIKITRKLTGVCQQVTPKVHELSEDRQKEEAVLSSYHGK